MTKIKHPSNRAERIRIREKKKSRFEEGRKDQIRRKFIEDAVRKQEAENELKQQRNQASDNIGG